MTLFMIGAAFCGGVIGSLTGAFQECLLAGIIAVFVTAFPQQELLSGLLSNGFIPYVAFSGAVAATAYASKIRKHDLAGTDILKSMNATGDISVLAVGGVFAVIGLGLATAVGKLGMTIDAGSVSVIISASVVRIIFGDGRFFNKNMKQIPRYRDQKGQWIYLGVLGLFIGAAAGYIALKTGNAFLPFYLSLASLLFYFLEPNFPPSHHMTCTAAYAFLATGSILWSAVWGAVASIVCTVIGDAVNTESSTHIDPPATTIGILSIIIYIIYYLIMH